MNDNEPTKEQLGANLLDTHGNSSTTPMSDVVSSDPPPTPPPKQKPEVVKFVRAVPALDEEEKNFYARHNKNICFDLQDELDKTYFDKNGKRRPNQINIAGVAYTFESHDDIKILATEMPVDNGLARIARIETFEKAAYEKVVEVEEGFDDYEHALQEGEQILFDFDCTEISDFPSTTNHINIYGTTKVSLVKSSKTGDYRLFFSIKEGLSEICVQESFFQNGAQPTCVCCCVDYEIPCCAPERKIHTSRNADYECNNYLASQFFTMPISSLLVDSVCYRALDNEYHATNLALHGPGGKGKQSCWDMYCGFLNCPPLDCLDDCKNEVCGIKFARNKKSVRFSAYERFNLGGDDPKYLPVVNQPTADGAWSVNAVNDDVIYIVVHYRSLLDHKNHSCKMRLTRSTNPTEQFQRAQKFVSILGHNRDAKLAEFFANGGSALGAGTRFDAIRSTQPAVRFVVQSDFSNVPYAVERIGTMLSCFYDKTETVQHLMNRMESMSRTFGSVSSITNRF